MKITKYRFISHFVSILRIFSKIPSDISPNPFFIVGSGRNGSTLLASILNAHKDIFIPPEQFFLPYIIMKRYLMFFWSAGKLKSYILETINKKEKTLNWNANLCNLKVYSKDIPTIINNIYRSYAAKKKGEIKVWGDKTPINIHFMNFIYPEFYNAKYIFLVRDPRDVVLSYKKLKKHKAYNTKYALWKWMDSIKKLKYLEDKTEVLIVKYENLVKEPEIEISRILQYLDLEVDTSILSVKYKAEEMGVGNKSHHKNLNLPISDTSIGKWKSNLSELDLSFFQQEDVKNMMKYFGYKL